MTEEKKHVFFLIGYGINGYPRLKKIFPDREGATKYILTLKRQICRSPKYEEKMLVSPTFFLHETAAAFNLLKIDLEKYPQYKKILNEQEPLYAIENEQKQESDRREYQDRNECRQATETSCSNRAQCC